MKKRLFTIFVAALACFAAAFTLAGCGNKDKNKGGNNSQDAYFTNVAASIFTGVYTVQAQDIEVENSRWLINKKTGKRTDMNNMVVTQDGELKGVFGRVGGNYSGYVNGKADFTQSSTSLEDGKTTTDSGVFFDVSACISGNETYISMDGDEIGMGVLKQNTLKTLPDYVYDLYDGVFAPDGILHKLMSGSKAGEINTYIKGVLEKFCTVSGSGSERTITFDPDMLSALNDDLANKPLSELIDGMFGEGFYADLNNKADKILNKTVGQLRDDVIGCGVTKAELYDFIDTVRHALDPDYEQIDIDKMFDSPMFGETPLKDSKVIDIIVNMSGKSAEEIREMISGVLSEYGNKTVYELVGEDMHDMIKGYLDEYVPMVKNSCTISATTDASGNIKSFDIVVDDFTLEMKGRYDEELDADYYEGWYISGKISLLPNSGDPSADDSAVADVKEELGVFDANATINVECGDCTYELKTDADGIVTSINAHAEYSWDYRSVVYDGDLNEDGKTDYYFQRTVNTASADLEYKYSDGGQVSYFDASVPYSDIADGWYELELDISSILESNNRTFDVTRTTEVETYIITDFEKYETSNGESGFELFNKSTTNEQTVKEAFFHGDGYSLTKSHISLYYNPKTDEWSNTHPANTVNY